MEATSVLKHRDPAEHISFPANMAEEPKFLLPVLSTQMPFFKKKNRPWNTQFVFADKWATYTENYFLAGDESCNHLAVFNFLLWQRKKCKVYTEEMPELVHTKRHTLTHTHGKL